MNTNPHDLIHIDVDGLPAPVTADHAAAHAAGDAAVADEVRRRRRVLSTAHPDGTPEEAQAILDDNTLPDVPDEEWATNTEVGVTE